MKKSIFIAVLGVAAGVASSYGQGYVTFTSYNANDTIGATTTIFGTSTLVPAGYSADLYYAFGTVADTVNNNSASSIASPVSGSFTDLGLAVGFASSGASAGHAGYFDGSTETIPGYTATTGAISFEVVAFNGSSWATSTVRGRSGAFTMTGIATGLATAPNLGDGADNFPNFYVASVPEPTSLALASLGGLASLVALRRKQA